MINISIEARMTSARLPGKKMKLVNGKPALEVMVERVKQSKLANKIIIATTTNLEDDVIVEWCKKNDVNFFRGSENNVYDRVLKTHQKFNKATIVELTGDCILITAELIDYAIQLYLDNNYDYVNVCDPTSMSAQIYSLKILESIKRDRKLEYLDKEHDTPYLYTSGKYKIFQAKIYEYLDFPKVAPDLDTKEDLEIINKICKNFNNFNFSYKEIEKFIKKNPYIININKHIRHKGLI
jgi:spore coat polysaccharide biosynthesis protein SpsF